MPHRISDRDRRVAEALVEYRNDKVSLKQLAARMSLSWGEFSASYVRLRVLAEAETVSQVIAWWLQRRLQ